MNSRNGTETTRGQTVSGFGDGAGSLPRRMMAICVADVRTVGDHTLYVGRVEYFEFGDDKPLLLYAGKYQQLLAGKE